MSMQTGATCCSTQFFFAARVDLFMKNLTVLARLETNLKNF